jgi:hypothetical protein
VSLERVDSCSVKIECILNFEEWIRTTNLRKTSILILICSKVMSIILAPFERNFCQFYLAHKIFQIAIIGVFDGQCLFYYTKILLLL